MLIRYYCFSFERYAAAADITLPYYAFMMRDAFSRHYFVLKDIAILIYFCPKILYLLPLDILLWYMMLCAMIFILFFFDIIIILLLFFFLMIIYYYYFHYFYGERYDMSSDIFIIMPMMMILLHMILFSPWYMPCHYYFSIRDAFDIIIYYLLSKRYDIFMRDIIIIFHVFHMSHWWWWYIIIAAIRHYDIFEAFSYIIIIFHRYYWYCHWA